MQASSVASVTAIDRPETERKDMLPLLFMITPDANVLRL
jgi:hypothetical protein